jgi:hypothetical protein
MEATRTTLERITNRASRRYGLVPHADAGAAGLTDWQIQSLVRSGRWERIVPGVYRIAGTPESCEQAVLAACYVAGRDALASHLTGLALLGVGMPPIVPHITVYKSKSARTRIAKVHRSRVLPIDRTTVGVIPCTTAARALVDVAPLVPHVELCNLTDTVLYKRLAMLSDVLGAIRRAGIGRHGIPSLRTALAPWLYGIRPGSPAEARLIRQLERWGFPTPVKQVPIVDESGRTIGTVDLGWPERKVGLEYEGGLTHTPREESGDESRYERIAELGWWISPVDRGDLKASNTRLRDELRPRLPRAA